jgi:hypothetical protein
LENYLLKITFHLGFYSAHNTHAKRCPPAAILNDPRPGAMKTSSMLNSFFLSAYLTQNIYGHPLRDWNDRALSRYNFHRSFLYFRSKTSVNLVYWSVAVGFFHFVLHVQCSTLSSASARTSLRPQQ